MELTDFTIRLFFIFFPGIIIQVIIDNLTVHEKYTPFQIIMYSLMYGFICYAIFYLITLVIGIDCFFFDFFSKIKINLNFKEIIFVTGLSIPLGFIFSALIYHKILYRFAKLLHISRKIGDPGIWSYTMTLDAKKLDTQWINVIDINNNILYFGFIQAFSDNNQKENEFLLRNVKVFKYEDNKIGELLYNTPGLYICRKRDNYIFEFPNMEYIDVD